MAIQLLKFGILTVAIVIAHGAAADTVQVPLDSLANLTLHKAAATPTVFKGRAALQVVEPGASNDDEDKLVILSGLDFVDGLIEVELAAAPAKEAGEFARGFVGLAFRIDQDASTFEAIYLRPTNGRAAQQIRRNHSVQYFSFPEYPWHRLRKETPGHYETHVDLVPNEWTKVKIQVRGTEARLFVHDSEQPTLIVNDLKLGERSGGVGLWIGPGTEAYFTNLRITQ